MRWVVALILGWLVCLPAAGWARSTIEARIDRDAIDLTGNVRLQVEVQTDTRDGDQPGQLLAPPLDDWDVLTQLQQQSFINRASTQVLTLVLRPHRPGKLTIGPFVLEADGKRIKTKPLSITVTGQAAPPPTPNIVDLTGGDPGTSSRPKLDQAPDRQAFLAWDVDKQNVWLGEQIHARLSLYVNRGLAVVDPNLRSFSTAGVLVGAFAPGPARSRAGRDRPRGLHPQHLGPLSAVPAALRRREAAGGARRSGAGRPLALRRAALQTTPRRRPADPGGPPPCRPRASPRVSPAPPWARSCSRPRWTEPRCAPRPACSSP
jgi:hypothetical protein